MSIMIVGEAFGAEEEKTGEPFVGSSGHLLNGLLAQAGIRREDCSITNAFNVRPPGNKVEHFFTRDPYEQDRSWPQYAPKMFVSKHHSHHLHELHTAIESLRPNVILALGDTALWALTSKRGIKKYRGAPMPTTNGEHKVIPSYHPAAVLRQFSLRPIVLQDVAKVAREAAFPEIRRPQRLITYAPSLEDIAAHYAEFIAPAKFLAVDIETKSRTITEVGFASSADRCLVIPFWERAARSGNYWPTPAEELAAWRWVKHILATKPCVGQNFQYDMSYLYTMGIPCPLFMGDTMLLHHALQPELEKSLGFLGSIYTDEPAWKFMRTAETETLKKED